MYKIQFIYSGGLGNQIFQFLASKYIEKKYKNINIYHSLSTNYQEKSFRKFQLNYVLKKEIKIVEEFNYDKNLICSNLFKRIKLTSKLINYINRNNIIYEADINNTNSISNPINNLSNKIEFFLKIKTKFKKKIIGTWENPTSYINILDQMKSYFKDERFKLPDYANNKKYICIHLRRGDFLSNRAHINGAFSNFSIVNFIIKSFHILPSEFDSLPIIVTTEDIDWTNSWIQLLGSKFKKEILVCNNDSLTDWYINKNAALNIISNSTFSYTAALLNNFSADNKLKCIVPQWIRNNQSSIEKGWTTPCGFLEI